jgi:hypothetical protein
MGSILDVAVMTPLKHNPTTVDTTQPFIWCRDDEPLALLSSETQTEIG